MLKNDEVTGLQFNDTTLKKAFLPLNNLEQKLLLLPFTICCRNSVYAEF